MQSFLDDFRKTIETAESRLLNLDLIAWETVTKSESVTLDYFMRDYVAHMKHHLRQITNN